MYSSFSNSSGLLQDLLSMLNDANDQDVIIKVGIDKEFRAHSNILKARSTYFKNVLLTESVIEFEKPNINPIVFEIILKYYIVTLFLKIFFL